MLNEPLPSLGSIFLAQHFFAPSSVVLSFKDLCYFFFFFPLVVSLWRTAPEKCKKLSVSRFLCVKAWAVKTINIQWNQEFCRMNNISQRSLWGFPLSFSTHCLTTEERKHLEMKCVVNIKQQGCFLLKPSSLANLNYFACVLEFPVICWVKSLKWL